MIHRKKMMPPDTSEAVSQQRNKGPHSHYNDAPMYFFFKLKLRKEHFSLI